MIKLDVVGHNEMCGGYGYSGYASFDGKTVKEVLEEIKEFVKDKEAHYLGDGFGNPESKNCDCWRIRIGDKIYLSNWCGDKSNYHHEYDKRRVQKIRVDGGWYCYYNFDIILVPERWEE